MKSVIDLAIQVKKYAAAGKTIADVENGTTAVGSYAVGEQFIREGVLYKAKTAITAGDTLTLNTNYELDDPVMEQLNSQKQALSDEVTTRAALGAHNLGDFQFISQTVNGVSYSVSNDKIVTCSGSGEITAQSNILTEFYLKAGTYKFTGCPSGGNSSSTYRMTAYKFAPSYSTIGIDTGNGFEFTLSEDSKIRVYLEFFSGYTFSGNVIFKPMITSPNDPDPTYQPYAMTNRELTDAVVPKAITITPATGIIIDYNLSYKIGNLAVLNFRFLIGNDVTVAGNLQLATISAKPKALNGTNSLLGNAYKTWEGSFAGIVDIAASTGILKLSTVGSFVAGGNYYLSMAYICE